MSKFLKKEERSIEKPPKKEKQKKRKKYSTTRLQKIVWAILISFIILSAMSIYSGFQAKSLADKSTKEIKKLNEELAVLKDMTEIDTPATDSFFRRFINVYYSVSTDKDEQADRVNQLSVFNKKLEYKLPTNPEVGQTVYSMRNYGYKKVDDYFVVTYTVETRTNEEKPQSFTSNVTIPFTKSEEGYTILSLPYQEEYDPNKYLANENNVLEPDKKEELDDRAVRDELKTFVEQFLTEYQANRKETLNYLMADVEGLGSNKKIELKNIQYFGTKDEPILDLDLSINNADTGIGFAEKMRLELTRTTDNKYFIETLKHY